MWAFHKHQWTETGSQYTLECRARKPRHYKERKRPFKGEVNSMGNMTLTAVGPYFDWPWWKRTLCDIAYRPYGTYKGIKGMLRRLTQHPHLLWRYHTHTSDTTHKVGYVTPLTAYDICSAQAEDRVRPIRWAVDMNRLIESIPEDER